MLTLIDAGKIGKYATIWYYSDKDDGYDEFILSSQYNNVKTVVKAERAGKDYFVKIIIETLVREQSGWRLYKVYSKHFVNGERARKTFEKLREIFDKLKGAGK